MLKYGTYTMGLTPDDIIRTAFADDETGGFSWDLRGEDSRNADRLDLHNFNETTLDGFLKIVDRLGDPGGYLRLEDDDELWEWASSMRSDMLGCIGIEEI